MGKLGDVLELLHGARDRVTTLRATVRIWHDHGVYREAMARLEQGGHVVFAVGDGPEREERRLRLWIAPGRRVREEADGPHGRTIAVRRGELWWRYDERIGAVTNEERPEVGGGVGEEFSTLLDPAPLIGLLDYGEIARARHAGRPSLHVHATPRDTGDHTEWPLMRIGAMGADGLLLDIDAERGVLLRVECRLGDRPFAISEIIDVAFDEVLPDDTFVFTPPPGERLRSVDEQFDIRHDLTIERAAAMASFPLWIAPRLPRDWELEISFAAEQERPPMAPHVYLHHRPRDGTHTITMAQSPADHPGQHSEYEHANPGPWREITRGGRRMQVREPRESWQPAQVLLELEGTRIHIHSNDLDAEALVDVAASLVRAPSDPPRLG